MKFFIIFALYLAIAFGLPGNDIKSRSVVVPAGRPEGRITKGHAASVGKFPYQVGLSLRDRYMTYHWCGGSLIGNQWVLTAAHCTEGIVELFVLLGSIIRRSGNVEYIVTHDNIIIHPAWNTETLENDISLIKIPFTAYSDNIQPVKLPTISKSYSTYAGDDVIVSGWGRLHDNDSGPTDYLQWIALKVMPNKSCAKRFSVQSSNICTAVVGGVNICDGDSGGPLVLEGSKIQVGLVSFSAISCVESDPAVYTRVTSYLDWIKEHTGIFY